jgi:RTX calcium-binding nonapeptide repeat (4 copies)
MRRVRYLSLLLVLCGTLTWANPSTSVAADPPRTVTAGAAIVDSTWHVGASAGQYASTEHCDPVVEEACAGLSVGDHGVEPFAHQTRRAPSYGIQGRESVRALVVEGMDGDRFAVVSNDLYIPQDLINRRVAGILQEHDLLNPTAATGITPENLTISVSHSHSSPYYSSPSWGVWAFQDVFDIRFFEHIARKMADAVIQASSSMVPVRMGAATIPFTVDDTPLGTSWLKKHSYGPTTSDDESPAGYPRRDTDRDLAVVRFDDITDPSSPKPLASWVVWGMHPENLDGNDLLTGEYVNAMYRIVDREVGGVTLFSQNDTGTAEAHDLTGGQVVTQTHAHPPHLRQEFSHREYAQVERAARKLSDYVETAWRDVEVVSAGGTVAPAHRVIPFRSSFEVGIKDLRFAPPGYRTLPTVSSCRTEKTFQGNPGIPLAGLPDCQFPFEPAEEAVDELPFDPGVTYETLRDLCDDGVVAACVPDNVGAPSYTGLQETLQVHLQAIRLGDIGITICPCEQWADQSRNIKTRLDKVPDNVWYGWDWTANYTDPAWEPGVIYDGKTDGSGNFLPGHGPITLNDWCVADGKGTPGTADDTWACKNTGNPAGPPKVISDYVFRRMKAQIYNDADGWDDTENSFNAETEPVELDKIWGNFTHEEYTNNGYDMVITVGMTNDYWGYLASYREFQRGDHYRKALTGLGPHSEDFMATRLSLMAASLNGGRDISQGPKDLAYNWDYQHQGLRQAALGNSARAYLGPYEAQQPSDGGTPGIAEQPTDIERFSTARIAWVGGSNFIDTPSVTVERCVAPGNACDPADPTHWKTYADGFGEVEVKANYPQPEDMPAWRAGQFEWVWEATFEAFDSEIALPDAQGVRRTKTPSDMYRFVIDGCHRAQVGTPNASLPDPACDSWDPSGRAQPYHLASEPFDVGPWVGITVDDVQVEADNTVSFTTGPVFPYPHRTSNTDELFDARFGSYEQTSPALDYPDTYDSPFRFIQPRNTGTSGRDEDVDVRIYDPADPLDDEVFCFHCSFRPWADTGAVAQALVTIERSGAGTIELASASYDPATGRWRTGAALQPGDVAYVDRGCVTDTFREFNGVRSEAVSTGGPAEPTAQGPGCDVEGPDLLSEIPANPPGGGPGGGGGGGGGPGGADGPGGGNPGGGGTGGGSGQGEGSGADNAQSVKPAGSSGSGVRCGPQPGNHVVGTARSERLIGTPGVDVICGFGGRDRLRGLGANDLLLGGPGRDVLIGGGGIDLCHGGGGTDRHRRCEDGRL